MPIIHNTAELLHGAEKSEYKTKSLKIVEDFISQLKVHTYDKKAATHYGEIRATLERQGNIIGLNDLHITAHAHGESLSPTT